MAPRVTHGKYLAGEGAYTRNSIYALDLSSESWNKKEEKRIARAKQAKENGKKIPDDALEFHEATLIEVDVPYKFEQLLLKKSALMSQLSYYIPQQIIDRLPKVVTESLREMYRPIDFTLYEDEGIYALAVAHELDNWSRKEGYTIAKGRWAKAKRGGYKTESPFIFSKTENK
jgi:hypothetical protein